MGLALNGNEIKGAALNGNILFEKGWVDLGAPATTWIYDKKYNDSASMTNPYGYCLGKINDDGSLVLVGSLEWSASQMSQDVYGTHQGYLIQPWTLPKELQINFKPTSTEFGDGTFVGTGKNPDEPFENSGYWKKQTAVADTKSEVFIDSDYHVNILAHGYVGMYSLVSINAKVWQAQS